MTPQLRSDYAKLRELIRRFMLRRDQTANDLNVEIARLDAGRRER